MRTGNFLDLTAEADVSDEALEAIRAQVEARDDAAGADRRAASAQQQAQARQQELVGGSCNSHEWHACRVLFFHEQNH